MMTHVRMCAIPGLSCVRGVCHTCEAAGPTTIWWSVPELSIYAMAAGLNPGYRKAMESGMGTYRKRGAAAPISHYTVGIDGHVSQNVSYDNSQPMRLCDSCGGSGAEVVESVGGSNILSGSPCPDCRGTGEARTEKDALVALAVAAEDALKNLVQAAGPYLLGKEITWLRCAISDTSAVRGRIAARKEN